MTAAHLNLARLPLEIFDNLICRNSNHDVQDEEDKEEWKDPSAVRDDICKKLVTLQQRSTSSANVQANQSHNHDNHHHNTATTRPSAPIVSVATVGQLLKIPTTTLLRILDPILTFDECEELRYRICLHCAAVPSSAFGLLQRKIPLHTTIQESDPMVSSSTIWTEPLCSHFNHHNNNNHMVLSTGIPTLDQHLQGGIRVGTITELVGRAGVGKSQLALQLCVVWATRYGQGSVYIDTEHKLQLSRLKQIAQQRLLHQQHQGASSSIRPLTAEQVMANVTIHTPTTTNELLATVTSMEEEILFRNSQAKDERHTSTSLSFPVRLVVVDSIAAPAKRDFGSLLLDKNNSSNNSAVQRVAAVLQCAQMLKRLASQLDLAVVVINQASVAFQPPSAAGAFADNHKLGRNHNTPSVRAALGTAWHHCVSTRLLMDFTTREHDLVDEHDEENNGVVVGVDCQAFPPRTLSVVKSNVVGYSTMNYRVTDSGLVEFDQKSRK